MERIVIIEAVSGRYAKNGKYVFHAVPYIDTLIDNYVTGQEKRSNRQDGLTKLQIEGKEPLTEDQKKKFPFPIVFNKEKRGVLPLYKKLKLNLSTDDKGNYLRIDDLAKYNFIVSGLDEVVAANKASVDPSKHLFYLEDPQKEAAKRVQIKREIFKMQQMVMSKLDTNSFYELILTLNFNTNDNYQFSNVSADILEDFVFDACEKHPDIIKTHFSEKGQRELFILKLLHWEIIFYRNSTFHDKSDKFLGNSVAEVLTYLAKKENQLAANGWSEILKGKDERYAGFLEKGKAKGTVLNEEK